MVETGHKIQNCRTKRNVKVKREVCKFVKKVMKQYVKKYGKIKKCMSKKEKRADRVNESFCLFFLRTGFEANENLTGKKSANQTRKQSLYRRNTNDMQSTNNYVEK